MISSQNWIERWVKLSFPLLIFLILGTSNQISAASAVTQQNSVNPSAWPQTRGISPQIRAWPNALQIYGEDRYQTSLATALTMYGSGEFPFDTPNPSLSAEQSIDGSSNWWGVGACPRAVIIVAGDSAADALAANALADPTGLSSQPYLRRTSASDLLFDPIGGYSRVDTKSAIVLLTGSTRQNYRSLSQPTRYAVKDLRSGGCTTARSAIIVGGYAAVPIGVDDELISLGFTQVFRIQGQNRYDTAARVSTSLGTSSVPNDVQGCAGRSSRMKFYANSVVEYRPSGQECQLLGKTVVLADGLTGADALAAGWWTSFWQVPVLLHNGTNDLPRYTIAALQTLGIKNLIILGGESRIPSKVSEDAKAFSGANILRIAGTDRYETSIQMAKLMGGWWPTGNAADFSSSLICFAASSGYGYDSRGWADALGAGSWCGAASGAASNPGVPIRALPPVSGQNPRNVSPLTIPSHDSVPIILVPTSAEDLPVSTSEFLKNIFPEGDHWCSSDEIRASCAEPSFAAVFGGPSVLSSKLISAISSIVGGEKTFPDGPIPRNLSSFFVTDLDMAPGYHLTGSVGTNICIGRAIAQNARWLAAGYENEPNVSENVDLMANGWYLVDADYVARTPGIQAPGCIKIDTANRSALWFRAVDISGRASAKSFIEVGDEHRFSLSGSLAMETPSASSGISTSADPSSGGETLMTYATGPMPQVVVNWETESSAVLASTITVLIQRSVSAVSSINDSFSATWTITTVNGTVVGKAVGVASLKNDTWALRGESSITNGTWSGPTGKGGFAANISVNSTSLSDDRLTWEVDGIGLKPKTS